MDIISEEELANVPASIIKAAKRSIIEYDDDTVTDIKVIMNSPLDVKQEEAAVLYNYLYQKRKKEITEKGIISDHTRRIQENFHALLDSIDNSMNGQKSVTMNLHGNLTPSHISAFIAKNKRDKK